MGIKKFIKNVTQSLDVDKIKISNKKKSMKKLLKKLEDRKQKLEKTILKNKDKGLVQELDIINLHIKKGNKILDKLSQDKDTKAKKG